MIGQRFGYLVVEAASDEKRDKSGAYKWVKRVYEYNFGEG